MSSTLDEEEFGGEVAHRLDGDPVAGWTVVLAMAAGEEAEGDHGGHQDQPRKTGAEQRP
jgi:hypothetical protein